MEKHLGKGIRAFALVAVCLLSALFFGFAADAAQTSDSVMIGFPREGDANGGYSEELWGTHAKTFLNGWKMDSCLTYNVYSQGSFDGQVCYCIEPGVSRYTGDTYTGLGEDFWDNYPAQYNSTISPQIIKILLGRVLQYGYNGNISASWRSQNDAEADRLAHIMATQVLVWETIVGERDAHFNHVDPGPCDAVRTVIAPGNPMYGKFLAYYDSMAASVQTHTIVPGFMSRSADLAQTVRLVWDGSRYSAVLTDENHVLANCSFSSDCASLAFSVNGNELTVSSDSPVDAPVLVTARKSQTRAGLLVWTDQEIGPDGGIQDVVTYSVSLSDPVQAFLYAETENSGSLRIVKTSEDGAISGISFTVSGNGEERAVTTGPDGETVLENLRPGTYTVTENTPDRYLPQEPKTVTVRTGETAQVAFANRLRRGNLRIVKTSEDGNISGISFTVAGGGETRTVKTGGDGAILIENLLPGVYTVSEDTLDRYEPQEPRTVTVEYGKTASVSFANVLRRGNLKIVKTSEDGRAAGLSFTVSGNGETRTVTTGSGGVILIENLLPGVYTVTEDVPERYEPQEPRTVTVEYGKTVSVNFENVLKRGSLSVTKTSEDGFVKGVRFRLYGTSDCGLSVDMTAQTDENGVAVFEGVLPGSGYILEETESDLRYIVPETIETAVEWNRETREQMKNVLRKFRVALRKTDAETGQAQGDADLSGAVYGLYRGETLTASYVTDENGEFLSDYFVCADDWTVREITPPKGYLPDPSVWPVAARPGLCTAEHNELSLGVTDQVIRGRISVLKHCDSGLTGIETPEEGACFEVYLKSAGGYDAAKESERDLLVCDGNGYAESRDLPYGVYTVHQVSGWDGREMTEDFDVFLDEDAKIYRFLLNNAVFESYLKVEKFDLETGSAIPYAGAGFSIFDPEGNPVSMKCPYPQNAVLDVFYTSSDGTLVTPEKLPYGKGYSLREVKAPYGYVPCGEPVFFDITEDLSETGTGIRLVTVKIGNQAQKGRISILKTGEVFASVRRDGERYLPVYEETGLPGAVFEISAKEDIVTPDGTVRAKAGTVLETVTTGKDGTARSGELYLGRYEIRETKAPYGMTLLTEPVDAELSFQEIAVSETALSLRDSRIRARVLVLKEMERDALFGVGEHGEVTQVRFGLYAKEELRAADGSVIPENALLGETFCNEKGEAVFECDPPFGAKLYVRETGTDTHYLPASDEYPVAFDEIPESGDTVTLRPGGGEPVYNTLLRGSVEGLKTDGDSSPVEGAVFGLFPQDETQFTEERALMLARTGEDGTFRFDRLVFGRYQVRETRTPSGYLPDETVFPVEIGEHSQKVGIHAVNRPVTGTARLTKVDRDYPQNRLSGAQFEIWRDADSDGTFDADADAFLGLMEETETGVYEIRDLRFGGYFAYEKQAPDGFRRDVVYRYFEIREDGETVTVENEAGVGFVNEARKGSLRIEKTSEDGKADGFAFRVEGENYCEEFLTDENGVISLENLRIGEYTVTELENEASKGYVLPPAETVSVFEGERSFVRFHNRRIPEEPAPETGDAAGLVLWGMISVLSLAGALSFAAVWTRRKEKQKRR